MLTRPQMTIQVRTHPLGKHEAQHMLPGPFLGSEAIAAGKVRKHELRSRYRAMLPGVYLPRGVVPTFRERVLAAHIWARRDAVFAGLTAARMFGAKWVDDDLPIEMFKHARPPDGVRCYSVQVPSDELCRIAGLPVTMPARTAFDIGRRYASREIDKAVAHLDALGRATSLRVEDVHDIADRHRGARGIRRLYEALEFYDPGAESPKETWLRVLLVKAGFPRPRTQTPVGPYFLDMGWENLKLAAEYDGDHHRSDPVQFAKDIERLERIAELGWLVLRASAKSDKEEIVRRFRHMWDRRVNETSLKGA
jgi:very-short-patch-repair endonuclease